MLPLHIFTFSRKILIAATVAVVSLVLAGLFLRQVHAQPLSLKNSARAANGVSSGIVYLSPTAQAAVEATPTMNTPILEVHIANNGLMLLRGARVISISGTTVRVGMAWDSNSFTWKLDTNYNTKFLTSKGEKETLADIQTGNIVSVTGMLIEGGAEPTIDAEFVRGSESHI